MTVQTVTKTTVIAGAIVMASSMFTAQANTLGDPTQPSRRSTVAVVPSEPIVRGPVLQSTLVAPGRKSAVISGRSVKVGDVYEGARVVDIRPYEVLLNRNGRESRLRLMPKLAKEKGVGE